MSLPVLQGGFTKSLAITVLSEVGDRTFCVAAILAMRYPRRSVLFGCLSSVIVTTILSALVGKAAPNLISREWAHYITTFLFFGFGLWSLWEAFNEDDDDNDELKHVEKELANDNFKKRNWPFLTHFFSPVFLKAFSVTFFGEWGDKSQLATIGLAADGDALAVILGGITDIFFPAGKHYARLQLLSEERAWHREYPKDWSHLWVESFSCFLASYPSSHQ